jgi:hypothetical protein
MANDQPLTPEQRAAIQHMAYAQNDLFCEHIRGYEATVVLLEKQLAEARGAAEEAKKPGGKP